MKGEKEKGEKGRGRLPGKIKGVIIN